MVESEMVERVKAVLRDKTDWTIDGKFGEAEAEESLTEAARAAIEAMREPTEEMADAGSSCLETYDPAEKCPSARDMENGWKAMIDAALSPSPATEKRNG